MSWCVVVPTCRESEFVRFMDAWRSLFESHDCHVIVVEDAPRKSSKVKKALGGLSCEHLSHSDVPEFVPRQTDMIRSWGFYKAWLTNCDYVLTLDDDVRPKWRGDIFSEYEYGFEKEWPKSKYFSTGSLTGSGLEMRGFPYKDREVSMARIQYGGWDGVHDYDAATQLTRKRAHTNFVRVTVPVPVGSPTTCCIMNCAWVREFTPIMWQLPMLEGRYNRTGDIWGGLFQKKVLDQMSAVMLINGKASVEHRRKSDPFTSLAKEAPSLRLNEDLWDNLEDGDYKTVTDSAYRFFKKHDKPYAEHFLRCRDQWLELFV